MLEVLEVLAEFLKVGGFCIVTDGDKGFEGRFVFEPSVFVDFLRTDRWFYGRVKFHPGHVAFEIVIGRKGCCSGF